MVWAPAVLSGRPALCSATPTRCNGSTNTCSPSQARSMQRFGLTKLLNSRPSGPTPARSPKPPCGSSDSEPFVSHSTRGRRARNELTVPNVATAPIPGPAGRRSVAGGEASLRAQPTGQHVSKSPAPRKVQEPSRPEHEPGTQRRIASANPNPLPSQHLRQVSQRS